MSFEHLLKTHHTDVDAFIDGGEMTQALFDVLYEYYFDEMPYGVAKARTHDPYQWIHDKFESHLEREGLLGRATDSTFSPSAIGEGKTMRACKGKGCGKKCPDGKNYCSKKCQSNTMDLKKEVPIDKKLKESKFTPGPFSRKGYVAEAESLTPNKGYFTQFKGQKVELGNCAGCGKKISNEGGMVSSKGKNYCSMNCATQ
jgi:hypothetical protein